MKQRIQKLIAAAGVCSRRAAEELITAGRVRCNGVQVGLGDQADPDKDEITVDGRPLPRTQNKVYIILNKPCGYVTTLSDERGRRTVAELVADCGARVYPVGRLDMDSEGLLLLTNDGALAHRLMHPRHGIRKTYRVWVRGYQPGGEAQLKRPIVLDGYCIRPPEVALVRAQGDRAELLVTIHEGRNRQIRRMCEAAGMTVSRLCRIREGSVELGSLPPGKWRPLTPAELTALRQE